MGLVTQKCCLVNWAEFLIDLWFALLTVMALTAIVALAHMSLKVLSGFEVIICNFPKKTHFKKCSRFRHDFVSLVRGACSFCYLLWEPEEQRKIISRPGPLPIRSWALIIIINELILRVFTLQMTVELSPLTQCSQILSVLSSHSLTHTSPLFATILLLVVSGIVINHFMKEH